MLGERAWGADASARTGVEPGGERRGRRYRGRALRPRVPRARLLLELRGCGYVRRVSVRHGFDMCVRGSSGLCALAPRRGLGVRDVVARARARGARW